MKVFISWSGELSREIGDALRRWLPSVLQYVKPFFTPKDIEKGARWSTDITKELDASEVGIICLTKDNLKEPWILFESGALSKSFDRAKVCTILFGIETTDITGPLTVFQHTRFEKSEFEKLVRSINLTAGDARLEDSILRDVFEKWWPDLEASIQQILAKGQANGTPPNRPDRDILEEILELTRLSAKHRPYKKAIPPGIIDELMHGIYRLVALAIAGDIAMVPFVYQDIDQALRHVVFGAGDDALKHGLKKFRREMDILMKRCSTMQSTHGTRDFKQAIAEGDQL